ncbi:hypothetical protein EVAR_97555_1 [Eumeta japonica]|uniref:Uncharacterized protein n=1 Tax=Eumeta variegata TaxID=151549 RepID=A0A4C1WPP0_EUMVA|nr:hypothetical protein EVAR_97555_1 [Eumeta japonica]
MQILPSVMIKLDLDPSRLRLNSSALKSDLGTAPYSNSEQALDSNFSPTLDSDLGAVLDFDLFQSRLPILFFGPFIEDIPSLLSQYGSGAVKGHRHQRDNNVRDQQLTTLCEARSV